MDGHQLAGPGRPGRKRKRRSDSGAVLYRERDGELLCLIAEQYALTIDQLARVIGGTLPTAHGLRGRWLRAGWVESRPIAWRQPSFIWLTREGAQVSQSPYRPLAPNPGLAAHTAAVTDLRFLLERELALGHWVCERWLRREALSQGERRPSLPDGVLETPAGRVAIEVELSLKSLPRLEAILEERARRYPQVWYFAPPRVAPTVERLAGETPWRHIRVLPFPAREADVPWTGPL